MTINTILQLSIIGLALFGLKEVLNPLPPTEA